MILECPSCHARFSVADHMIPPAGRTVRCSKCAHAWHVEPQAAAVEAELYRPEPTEAIVPSGEAVSPPSLPPEPEMEMRPRARIRPMRRADDPKPMSAKPFKIAVPLIAASWFVLAFITYSPSWANGGILSGIYRGMGATPTDGLAFADVAMTREQDGAKTRFILTGSVRNNASSQRIVPTVRVMLKDKAGKTLWGREYAVNAEVKAGEVYPFRITNVETAFAKNIDKIIVDMGNSMQLLVR